MSAALLTPVELRAQGFDALVKALGWINAVRFIQQFESSRLNYTAEREAMLPQDLADDLIAKLRKLPSR